MSNTEQRERARATWAAGDFDAIAERIWAVGDDLVERVGVSAGQRAIDVACGTGNAAIPAAVAGAEVTGLDITPELFEDGRRRAPRGGGRGRMGRGRRRGAALRRGELRPRALHLRLHVRPRPRAAAAEIARVLKPGGRMGVAAWSPQGAIGQFFATIAKHAPPPPEGFQPPPLWGVRDHVSEIFAGTGLELAFEDAAAHWKFESVDEMVEEYATKFGPIVLLRSTLDADGRRALESRPDARSSRRSAYSEGDGIAFDGEYLVTLGRKPG